jgi:hypothetical protein
MFCCCSFELNIPPIFLQLFFEHIWPFSLPLYSLSFHFHMFLAPTKPFLAFSCASSHQTGMLLGMRVGILNLCGPHLFIKLFVLLFFHSSLISDGLIVPCIHLTLSVQSYSPDPKFCPYISACFFEIFLAIFEHFLIIPFIEIIYPFPPFNFFLFYSLLVLFLLSKFLFLYHIASLYPYRLCLFYPHTSHIQCISYSP